MNGNEKYKSGQNPQFWLNDMMTGQSGGGASGVSAPSVAAGGGGMSATNSTSLPSPFYMDHMYRHQSGEIMVPSTYPYPIDGFSQTFNPTQQHFENINRSQASTSSSLQPSNAFHSSTFMTELGLPHSNRAFHMPSLGIPYNPPNISYGVPAVSQQNQLPSPMIPVQKVGNNHTSQSSTVPNSSQLKHDGQYTTLKPVNDKKYHQHNPKPKPVQQIDHRRNDNHNQQQSKEKQPQQQHKSSTNSSKMHPSDPALSLSKSVTQLTSPLHTDFYSPTSTTPSVRNQHMKMAKVQYSQDRSKFNVGYGCRYPGLGVQHSASHQYLPDGGANSSSPFNTLAQYPSKFYEPNPSVYSPSGQNRYSDSNRPSTTMPNEKMGVAADNLKKVTSKVAVGSRNFKEAPPVSILPAGYTTQRKPVDSFSHMLSSTTTMDRRQQMQQHIQDLNMCGLNMPIPYDRFKADADKFYKTQLIQQQQQQQRKPTVARMAEKIAKCQESDVTPNEVKEKLGLREIAKSTCPAATDGGHLTTPQQQRSTNSPPYPYNQQHDNNNNKNEGPPSPIPYNSLNHNSSKVSSSATTTANVGAMVRSGSNDDHKQSGQRTTTMQSTYHQTCDRGTRKWEDVKEADAVAFMAKSLSNELDNHYQRPLHQQRQHAMVVNNEGGAAAAGQDAASAVVKQPQFITKRKVNQHNGVGGESPPPKKPHFDSGLVTSNVGAEQQQTSGQQAAAMPSSHGDMIRLTTTATTNATISSSSSGNISTNSSTSTVTTPTLSTTPISSYPKYIISTQAAVSTVAQLVPVAEFIQKDKKSSSATKKRGRKPRPRPNADVTTQESAAAIISMPPLIANIKVESPHSPMSKPPSDQLMAPPQTPPPSSSSHTSPGFTKLGKRVGRPPKKKLQQSTPSKHTANVAKRTPNNKSSSGHRTLTNVPRPSRSLGSSDLTTKIISFKPPHDSGRLGARSGGKHSLRKSTSQQQALPPTPKHLKKVHCQGAVGQTLLHKSAQLGYVENVEYYLENSTCNVNDKDNAGYTALHEACVTNQIDVAKVLFQFGADPNANASCGTRPIHDAIEHNHMEMVHLLLACGADLSLNKYSGKGTHDLARTPKMKRFIDGEIRKLRILNKDDVDDDKSWRWNLSCSKIQDRRTNEIGYDPFLAVPNDKISHEMEFLVFKDEPPTCYYVRPLSMKKNEKLRCTNYFKLDDVLKIEDKSRVDCILDGGVNIKTVRSNLLKVPAKQEADDQSSTLVDLVDCRSKFDKCKSDLYTMDCKTGRTTIKLQKQPECGGLNHVKMSLNFSINEQEEKDESAAAAAAGRSGDMSPIHPSFNNSKTSCDFVSSSPMKNHHQSECGVVKVKQEPSEHHHRHRHYHHHHAGMPRLNADPFTQSINFSSVTSADSSTSSSEDGGSRKNDISFEDFLKEMDNSPKTSSAAVNHEAATTNGDAAVTSGLLDASSAVKSSTDYAMKCGTSTTVDNSTTPSSDETSSGSLAAAASC